MIPTAVTDDLLHLLVASSHAEGTTCLAVAAAIEHDERILLIATADDFEPVWQLPTDLVLPGETLLDGLHRTVTTTAGLDIIDITSYAGHHDRVAGDEIIRTFVFTVTAADPERVCRWANIGHRWTTDPVTAASVLGQCQPDDTTTTPAALIGPIPISQLSAALRANAKGLLCAEAAVELLINHQSWLWRKDFVTDFIDTATNITHQRPGCFDTAFVDWANAIAALNNGQLPCSSGEAQLLRIAGSLGEGISVDLHDTLTGLDSTNTRLVAQAIYHATGHRP